MVSDPEHGPFICAPARFLGPGELGFKGLYRLPETMDPDIRDAYPRYESPGGEDNPALRPFNSFKPIGEPRGAVS